jgi:hypothetical protein
MATRNAPGRGLKAAGGKFLKAKVFGIPAPLVAVGAIGIVYILHKRSQATAAGDGTGTNAASDTSGAEGGAGSGGGSAGGGGGTFVVPSSGGGSTTPARRVVKRNVTRNVTRINRRTVINAPSARRVHVGASNPRGRQARTPVRRLPAATSTRVQRA